MENYFLRVKTFSRGKGSSATKAAAYRTNGMGAESFDTLGVTSSNAKVDCANSLLAHDKKGKTSAQTWLR